jgi:hypothetical protein
MISLQNLKKIFIVIEPQTKAKKQPGPRQKGGVNRLFPEGKNFKIKVEKTYNCYITELRGFAPIGIVEKWSNGMMRLKVFSIRTTFQFLGDMLGR